MARILVADDDDDIRDLVRIRLTAWGHEVLPVRDGEAALQVLREHQVDLAMLDVMMPRRTGLDVLTEYRADGGPDQVPVVMMSARCLDSDIAAAAAAGATDYLVKPFNLTALTEIVAKLTAPGARVSA
jgi:DNA-binding response OmpR family regulator